jgi:hypothetical protein
MDEPAAEFLVSRARTIDVLNALARVEGKVDAALIGQSRIESMVNSQEGRLRDAERAIVALQSTRPRRVDWTSVTSAVVAVFMALLVLLRVYNP